MKDDQHAKEEEERKRFEDLRTSLVIERRSSLKD